MFITLLVLNMAYLTGTCIFIIVTHPHNSDAWKFLEGFYPCIIFYIIAGVIFIISMIFLPFTFILSVVHLGNFCKNMTTNERFSRRNDGENNSVLSKSILDNSQLDNTSALLADSHTDTLLRTTFMGPKNGNCFGN